MSIAFDSLLLRLTPRGMAGAVSAAAPVRQGRVVSLRGSSGPSLTSSGGGAGRGLGLSAPLPVPSYRGYLDALDANYRKFVTGPIAPDAR